MASDKQAIAQANAQKAAELFGSDEPPVFDLPLRNGAVWQLVLHEPSAREVMEIIAASGNEFLLAQAAIELVTGGVDIPASKITQEGYIALRRKCYELCCFIAEPSGADTAHDAVKADEGEGKTPAPLSPSL